MATPDIFVSLGDFQFEGMEVPESLPFGGSQQLVIHNLIGGKRTIDALGQDDDAVSWSGLLLGSNASIRADVLNSMRKSGDELVLTWDHYRYRVIIRSFKPIFMRPNRIPYQINLEVIEDLTIPLDPEDVAIAIDNAVQTDNVAMQTLAPQVDDSLLTQLLGTLDTAINAVSNFAKAASDTIDSVLTPLKEVQDRVSILVSTTANTLRNISTFGGLIPENPLANRVSKLTQGVDSAIQQPLLLQLQAASSRMHANLSLAKGPTTQNLTAIGNSTLYTVAANEYGDASKWDQIAAANNLTDPYIVTPKEIIVPVLNPGLV